MVNRINRESTRNADTRNASRSDFYSNSKASSGLKQYDDVIVRLANSRENRRARQVGEWERLRKHTLRAAI